MVVSVTLGLAGDVMTGRGIDQVLPHPGDPRLWEAYVHDAGRYVALAEDVSGPIPRPVGFDWPWGDVLATLAQVAPAARLINLETSITRGGEPAFGKAVHYRMTPENLPCLTVARPDLCGLANNHVLDFGPAGLAETLATCAAAGLPVAGAGADAAAAARPVAVPLRGGGRVVVSACADGSSGVPSDWAATADRPGVNLLPGLSGEVAAGLAAGLGRGRRPGDLTVVSIHWGSNWGYEVPDEQVTFAHRLIEGGVDLVHGHSSHHPRPIELYRGKLILYGCGDLLNDYEGIGAGGPDQRGQRYRDDLRPLYFATLDRRTGELRALRIAPMVSHRLRLRHASPADAEWLRGTLDRVSAPYRVRVRTVPGAVPPAPVLAVRVADVG